MNKLFLNQSCSLLLSMGLMIGLSACGESREAFIPPTANDALHAMRQQDDSIVQVKLQQCIRSNPFEGQPGNGPSYDQYDCEVVVERYDAVLDQSMTQAQSVLLNLGSSGWQAEY